MASAHDVPDGTVPCLWLVVLSDSCGMVLVCTCSVASPCVSCVNCPDVTFVSDRREFCMNSVIPIYHVAESPLSRPDWVVTVKEGSYTSLPCVMPVRFLEMNGCVLRALDSHLSLSDRITKGPRDAPT